MAVMKRLIIVLGLVVAPLLLGLLFTYDIIKIEWISMMEIQPSYNPQEDPLPMPARSVPIQGAYNDPNLGAPVNPIPASENSLARGKYFYDINCAICHGPEGAGGKIVTKSIKGTAEAKVLGMIKNGGGKMKPVALPDADATAVAKYVAGLK